MCIKNILLYLNKSVYEFKKMMSIIVIVAVAVGDVLKGKNRGR